MKYDISIYDHSADNLSRFALGTNGTKPLFVIGLNPSTADDKKSDLTISKVIGFANRHGCDSFVMFNLYPQRATYPDKLPATVDSNLHNENISHILTALQDRDNISILAAWGETITVRQFFKKCLADIFAQTKNKNVKWLTIGLTKSGHPRHPSRAGYCTLTDFNIENYLTTI